MKSTLLCAMAALTPCTALLAAPMAGPITAQEQTPSQPKEVVKKKEPVPFDYDLFRRDEQVVSSHVEALYWGIYEGCLDYALVMENGAWSSTSSSYAQGEYQSARYDWEPGFRVGISYFRAPRYWEVKGQYTRLQSRGKNSSGKPGDASVYLTGTWPQITTNPLVGAKSHIHMNYNVFDLLVDRYFNPNPHLRLRLIGGTTIAWIDQNWTIDYFDASCQGTTIRNKWRFIGAGLKTGTMVDWYWGRNIYVTGSSVFGALMGGYWNKSLQTVSFQPTANDNPATPIRNTKFFDPHPAFTIQAMFGPSWQQNFDSCRVEAFAGYELNVWLNLQQIYRSTSSLPSAAKETWINTSALAAQGLTVRLTIDY